MGILNRRKKVVLHRRRKEFNDDLYGRLRPFVKVLLDECWNRKYEKKYEEKEIGELYDLIKEETILVHRAFTFDKAMKLMAVLREEIKEKPNNSPFHYFLFDSKSAKKQLVIT